MQVIENLNLAGLDHAYVCTAVSSNRVLFTHCALRLKKSGTIVPRMELVEVGPSMDFVVRRHRLPNESLRKEAMKTAKDQSKKKVDSLDIILLFHYMSLKWKITVVWPCFCLQVKNVGQDAIQGKIGKIYIPDQKVRKKSCPLYTYLISFHFFHSCPLPRPLSVAVFFFFLLAYPPSPSNLILCIYHS